MCNLFDLLEVLKLYYTNKLDNINNFLSRLYKPIRDLKPGNTLFGLLDNDDVYECLCKLDVNDLSAIEYWYTNRVDALDNLKSLYTSKNTDKSFTEFITDRFCIAIQSLADEVIRLI